MDRPPDKPVHKHYVSQGGALMKRIFAIVLTLLVTTGLTLSSANAANGSDPVCYGHHSCWCGHPH